MFSEGPFDNTMDLSGVGSEFRFSVAAGRFSGLRADTVTLDSLQWLADSRFPKKFLRPASIY